MCVPVHCVVPLSLVIFRGVQESSGAVWPVGPVERGLRWDPPASPGLAQATPDMQAMFDKKALTIINIHVNLVSPPEVRMFVILSGISPITLWSGCS